MESLNSTIIIYLYYIVFVESLKWRRMGLGFLPSLGCHVKRAGDFPSAHRILGEGFCCDENAF